MISDERGPTLHLKPSVDTARRLTLLTAHQAAHGLVLPAGCRLARFTLLHETPWPEPAASSTSRG